MPADLMDGRTTAAAVRQRVARGVSDFVAAGDQPPGLATVLIGEDPASQVYIRSKRRLCVEVGMVDMHRHLAGDASQAEAEALVRGLADDPAVSGILLQLPLPGHLDADALLSLIPPGKDVDGLTTASAGRLAQGRAGLRPCTPAGVLALLDAHGVVLAGAEAVVVGRSVLVGRPMAQLLTERSATVTLAHSRTRELASVCRRAEVLVVAAGVPHLVGAGAVAPGATVIDVGIHRTASGLCGDVDTAAVMGTAARITPVPGGVGPMTIAMLLDNTLSAARGQRDAQRDAQDAPAASRTTA